VIGAGQSRLFRDVHVMSAFPPTDTQRKRCVQLSQYWIAVGAGDFLI
jgi:hypothetical protein